MVQVQYLRRYKSKIRDQRLNAYWSFIVMQFNDLQPMLAKVKNSQSITGCRLKIHNDGSQRFITVYPINYGYQESEDS